jgi:glycosyltransferase involved in cell wall biosynthesis
MPKTATLPSFDLVVATVDRVEPLARLLDSLERQTHAALRVLVVDQNDDGRVEPILSRPGLEIVHLRSPRGLSRARNAALPRITADVVAFPDDDCVYADDLLERVGRRFATRPELDGLSGRAVDSTGHGDPSWADGAAVLEPDNLWNRAISFAIFLRGTVVSRVGSFDEELGLGSGTPWHSGEEIDYLVRAVLAGARIEYDPALTVTHDLATLTPHELVARGRRDGASVGYILRKHRYPRRTVGRMLVRPVGGALVCLAQGDRALARFHLTSLRGRLDGLRAGGGR